MRQSIGVAIRPPPSSSPLVIPPRPPLYLGSTVVLCRNLQHLQSCLVEHKGLYHHIRLVVRKGHRGGLMLSIKGCIIKSHPIGCQKGTGSQSGGVNVLG